MANKNSEDYSVLRWGVAGAGKISTDFVCAVNADSPDKHKVRKTVSVSKTNF